MAQCSFDTVSEILYAYSMGTSFENTHFCWCMSGIEDSSEFVLVPVLLRVTTSTRPTWPQMSFSYTFLYKYAKRRTIKFHPQFLTGEQKPGKAAPLHQILSDLHNCYIDRFVRSWWFQRYIIHISFINKMGIPWLLTRLCKTYRLPLHGH